MEDNTPNNPMNEEAGYFSRLVSHDAARKGVAAALAGVLVAAISEALWPSK